MAKMVTEGDSTAFDTLFARHSDSIYAMLLKYTGNSNDVNDLMQEAFMKAFLKIGLYDPKYDFGAWIYTIARNTLVDHLRRRADDVAIDERFRAPAATTPTPEESVIISQTRAHFEASLDELSVEYRRIIEMRFLEEYSYEEIAEKLGRPLNTIKTQIRRAKAQVCRMILDKE